MIKEKIKNKLTRSARSGIFLPLMNLSLPKPSSHLVTTSFKVSLGVLL